MTARFLIPVLLAAIPAARSAEPEPPALAKLRTQRETAAAAALVPLDRDYRAGLQRILARATQVGALATVERIQDTLRRLDGKEPEGKPPAAPTASPAAPAPAVPSSGIFGDPNR